MHKKKTIAYYKSLFKDGYIKTYKDYVCVSETGDLFLPDYTGRRFSDILKQNDYSSKTKSASVIENALVLDIKKDILDSTPNISTK